MHRVDVTVWGGHCPASCDELDGTYCKRFKTQLLDDGPDGCLRCEECQETIVGHALDDSMEDPDG